MCVLDAIYYGLVSKKIAVGNLRKTIVTIKEDNGNCAQITEKIIVTGEYYEEIKVTYLLTHHVQHLSSGGGAEVLPVPYGDGFEAEKFINFLGQSILFHNLC